jgi:hypothetical protein
MEAHLKLEPELLDPFEREVDEALPEGEDRAASMLRADYLLQRIREELARRDEYAEFIARRIHMVAEDGKAAMAKAERRIAFLESRLRMHLPQTGEGMEREYGRKSLALPHGVVGYRAPPAGVRIIDAKRVVAWAKSTGAVPVEEKVEEKVTVAALKQYVATTGDIPEGAEWADAKETFYVTPAKVEGH